jgi:HAE1 family hydrophobic/amphiphilic exporter-1
MQLIEGSIKYPVSTTVGVILLLIFGGIALLQIPIQLVPDVEEPTITVTTVWPGASPQEIEREIVDEQEEQLKSLEGLIKLESSSSDSSGTVTLTFSVDTALEAALLRVANRLEQVPSYPDDVDKPVIRSTDPNAGAMAWFILEAAGDKPFQGDISTLWDFCDDNIKPAFERVPGVANSNIFGGRERELQVIFDPAKLAARRITLSEMAAAIDRENRNYSGGSFDEGKRRYVIRTVGEYLSPADIEKVIITQRNGVPVYVGDVARVQLDYKKAFAQVFQKGDLVLAMNAVKQPGANSLTSMAALKETVAALNAELLAPRGLQLTQAYDETDYIISAVDLVTNNLYVGAVLATLVLLLFLRSGSATLVVAVSIPISMVGAFLILQAMGRTLNVISLAGMAFASGMVVDNSIVVLENIYRHRQMGKARFQAALEGAREVWGAVLASTLTTIAVFIPVVFIREEAGQLFADIAVAVSAAVGLSLLISISVVPMLSSKILTAAESEAEQKGWHNLWGGLRLAERFRDGIGNMVYWINGGWMRRLAVIVGMTSASVLLAWAIVPKAEYLPTGNSNFAFGLVLPPPGYNLAETAGMRKPIEDHIRPLWEAKEGSPAAAALPGGGIKNFFYVAIPGMSFMGARANDALRVRQLIPPAQTGISQVPGAIGFISQSSIFQRGIGVGRNIDIEITGPELDHLIELGGRVFGEVMQKLPGSQARPIPSLDLGNPEVRVLTHRRRAADVHVSNRDLGFTVNALVDGAKVSDYREHGKEIDLTLRGEDSFAERTHDIEMIPVATADGRLVNLGALAEIGVVDGPVQINHRERQRVITIQVQPSDQMPLEAAMDIIRTQIVEPLQKEGALGGLYRATLSGSADKLTQTRRAFQWNFLLAVVITYLLMAALFESFLHPLVIMFSVPLGAVGGFIGLRLVNGWAGYQEGGWRAMWQGLTEQATFQALDVLTMLGFIILVGTVVNNAILIVHQSLNHIREEGMSPREAIRESVQNRMRPMLMTTGTSVFGMLPMVIAPGAGSELYRGLGAVITGGLVVATVFTLFLVPAMFSLALDAQSALERAWRRVAGARAGASAPGD